MSNFRPEQGEVRLEQQQKIGKVRFYDSMTMLSKAEKEEKCPAFPVNKSLSSIS